MDLFSLIVFGSLTSVVLILLALGRFSGRRADDITNEDRHERWGAQAAIEERDIGEMVEGQNVYRRRRNRPPITAAGVQRRIGREERDRLALAEAEQDGRRTKPSS